VIAAGKDDRGGLGGVGVGATTAVHGHVQWGTEQDQAAACETTVSIP
jgi:hypothetical protein